MAFSAKYTLLEKGQCVPSFKWSFGDGFDAVGENITHTYKYAGEYQIVLNGTCGNYNATSRTSIKIISPNILLSNLSNGDVEIINNDNTEINIGDWKIIGFPKVFIFPQDTIIAANNKIILSKQDTGESSSTEEIFLNDPSNDEVSVIDIKSTSTSSKIALGQDATSTNNPYVSIEKIEPSSGKNKKILNSENLSATKIVENSINVNDDNTDQAAAVAIASSTAGGSFWSKLIDIPVRSVESFARIFYNF